MKIRPHGFRQVRERRRYWEKCCESEHFGIVLRFLCPKAQINTTPPPHKAPERCPIFNGCSTKHISSCCGLSALSDKALEAKKKKNLLSATFTLNGTKAMRMDCTSFLLAGEPNVLVWHPEPQQNKKTEENTVQVQTSPHTSVRSQVMIEMDFFLDHPVH